MAPEAEATPIDSAVVAADRMRRHVIDMTHTAGSSHVGSCLSAVDILAAVFMGSGLRFEGSLEHRDRDAFILSKGHAAAALYAAVAEAGLLEETHLAAFCSDGSPLIGHANHAVPGVDVSSGSLGHGVAVATGLALARRSHGDSGQVIVLLSDGECDEGSTWEGALLAGHLRLDNVIAIVDHNRIQGLGTTAEVLDLEPFAAKWAAFGWDVVDCDGHDIAALVTRLAEPRSRPRCIIAQTVKGHGVSFMEGRVEWHYQSPDADAHRAALAELEAGARQTEDPAP